ncbi:helix-turn-helix domain-containing protein [Allobranchiibius sp. GilTou38]|uniref:PucR family transcriptional regulator n=1 Tax=Allobranchiibius sp. GilTou38 TaxID=2815210 RepID=UPI001AA0DAE3|nr:helix-turn-helix domain-containing protein [Allobranchiibius sp. GilTou38]MBO1766745.1 helix-turn-helix domain-containing protein [Allobranchiibius sp. GilTou38]
MRRAIVDKCASAVFRENIDDAVFLEALEASVSENAQALRDVLAGQLDLDDIPLTHRLRFTALEAEVRVEQASLQRSYRISFFLQGQEWSQVVAAEAQRLELSRDDAVDALTTLAIVVQAYSDAVISRMAQDLARSEDALNRSKAHVQQRLVRDLLEGREAGLSPADLIILGYALDASHLAILLPYTPQGLANQLLVGLREAVRPSGSLVYPVRLGCSAIWLGSPKTWSDERIGRVVATLRKAGVTACLSEPRPGTTGFCKAYQQVRQVESLEAGWSDRTTPTVVQYAQLRLEVLLMQSPELAQEFLDQELGALADSSLEAGKLRDTIEASFRLGSHVAAANYLQLHEHTVRNRLQKVQEILGAYQDRRTEILVALRLRRMLATR